MDTHPHTPTTNAAGRDPRRHAPRSLAARLGVLELREDPARTAFALVAMTAGVLAVAVDPSNTVVGASSALAGFVVVAATASAMTSSPTPESEQRSTLLRALGATDRTRAQRVRAAVMLVALPATVLGLLAGILVGIACHTGVRILWAALAGVGVPLLFTGLRTSDAGVHGDEGAATGRPRTGALVARLGAGVFALAIGALFPGSSETFSDLNLALWPGLAAVGVGVVLLAPPTRRGAARLAERLPLGRSGTLAARLLGRPGGGTDVAVGLAAITTAIVVVLSVLGTGFTTRETRRRAALPVHTFTAGTTTNQIVGRNANLLDLFPSAQPDVASLTASLPGAHVAVLRTPGIPSGDTLPTEPPTPRPTELLQPQLDVCPAAGVTMLGTGEVALATPAVLSALGLESFAPVLARGDALALDPGVLRDGAHVGLLCRTSDGAHTAAAGIELPATLASTTRVGAQLPSVLVSAETLHAHGVPTTSQVTLGVVASLPHAPSEADVAAVRAALPQSATVEPGDTADLTRLDATRLDDAASVLRTATDRRAATVTAVVLMLAVILLTLRFAAIARRQDDDVLALLGARVGTRRAREAWQSGLLATTGILLGVVSGLATSALGLFVYNHRGRFSGKTLPPIPYQVPAELLLLLAVPLFAAVITAATTRGRTRAAEQRLLVRPT